MSRNNFISSLATAKVAIINTDTGSRAIYKAFGNLCKHQTPTIAHTSCREQQLPALLEQCASHNVFALVLGSAPVLASPKPFSATVIAPSISKEKNYIRHLLQDARVHNFSALAPQTYLTPPGIFEEINTRYFETIRLGILREDLALAEPLLRDTDYVWFDLGAVRAGDAPQTLRAEPNGLYAEEACKLINYIALSNRAMVLFLFGYKPLLNHKSPTAKLAGQMIWFLLEGLSERIVENIDTDISTHAGLKKIVVDMDISGQEMCFINSITTQRWWMEVPSRQNTTQWIPCRRQDYQAACRGEVPLRWLWHYQKLNY